MAGSSRGDGSGVNGQALIDNGFFLTIALNFDPRWPLRKRKMNCQILIMRAMFRLSRLFANDKCWDGGFVRKALGARRLVCFQVGVHVLIAVYIGCQALQD